jgi:hypothetical protein
VVAPKPAIQPDSKPASEPKVSNELEVVELDVDVADVDVADGPTVYELEDEVGLLRDMLTESRRDLRLARRDRRRADRLDRRAARRERRGG